MKIKPINKLMVANRSEIAIRVFRTATELGIKTVAIYSFEDRFALHRFKADEAYQVGNQGEPIRAYLDIAGIIKIAKQCNVDAIHPGYGFLSENPELATACKDAGVIFVGPTPETLVQLGDKTLARELAINANVPVLGGSESAILYLNEGMQTADELGYPIILKAAHGGGGRGMRIVRRSEDFAELYESARRESLSAFGSPDIFIEKFITNARHIEVQLLGDHHGNLVHLHERDCSVQRRHQKVVEIAPAPNLQPKLRDELCEAALRIGNSVGYQCAGTVEFLLDADTDKFYFIEVNPRIQVEHTVTEEVTGIDIVKSQIQVSQGIPFAEPEMDISHQTEISTHGFALQCRVTTENPENDFLPDYGRLMHYRSASGMGIRLDAGSAFSGAVVFPYYDSMLVKVTARGKRFEDAIRKMNRALQEFRIRGVKTNIPFLHQLIQHPTFCEGLCTTQFIDKTPELFKLKPRRDRATKLLTYLAEVIVNEQEHVKGRIKTLRREPAPLPTIDMEKPVPQGARDIFLQLGAEKFSQWILDQNRLLITDTTMRDAHQSLLATRMRTFDLIKIADAYARTCPDLFSLEMWGGATFDTTMRFLKESPWQRLSQLREKIPNILFQMLLRASNAVGYTNYADNVVVAFVKEAADAGIDIFRVFDALNWLPNMKVAMEAVKNTNAICEASICYTGDILNPERDKYDLKYYINLAKELEKMGANILAIKDMAGLCKPEAAEILVTALKQEIGIPIHFHTHDTNGIQAASILRASEAGLDIADAAMAPLSGGTSQPNLNALCEALRYSDRHTELETEPLDDISGYWRAAREFYTPFESVVLPATSDLYEHEMPGGQYTNLFQQARALGMADRWGEICHVYAEVNRLFGDIVKVTPTSKAVGDMALFMVANDLTKDDILDTNREHAFPQSVIDLIGGRMGQPPGGFPAEVIRSVLKQEEPMLERPGSILPPVDFEQATSEVEQFLSRTPTQQEVVTYVLYPKVYREYEEHQLKYSDTSLLPTPEFFYGLKTNEEFSVDIESGKTLIIRFVSVGEPHANGNRTVFFELNGQPRSVSVLDLSLAASIVKAAQADPQTAGHVGASMPGMVVSVAVKEGDVVEKGDKLLSLEAMKMESTINAEQNGRVKSILVKAGDQVEQGYLLMELEI